MSENPIPYGYCHCGCGQRTTPAKRDRPKRGIRKGEPNRFCMGHKPPDKRQESASPGAGILRDLYCEQRKSTREIGEMCGVAHITVRRWLAACGIPIRPTGSGLLNRGIEAPAADELYRFVHVEHLSYSQIASMYGVDQSAIRHWLIGCNIPTPDDTWYSRRGGSIPEINIDELRSQYESGESVMSLAEIHGVSVAHVNKIMNRNDIPRRPDGFGGKRITCQDGHLVRSTYESRVDDWLYEHDIPHIYEPALPFDRRYHADFYANGYYVEIWGVTNSPSYAARMKKKVSLYAAHNAPLIQIHKWQFGVRYKGLWGRQLNRLLTYPLPDPLFATL